MQPNFYDANLNQIYDRFIQIEIVLNFKSQYLLIKSTERQKILFRFTFHEILSVDSYEKSFNGEK